MEAIARARYVRTSPRKARLVVDAIRGKEVREALAILRYTPNRAARIVEKVVRSAVANAENNFHMDADNLRISRAFVDGGPNIIKRLRYAPMGRGYRIIKRMSHITIAVEETEPKPDRKARRRPATGAAAKRAAASEARVGETKKVSAIAEEKPIEPTTETQKSVEGEETQTEVENKADIQDTESEGKGGA